MPREVHPDDTPPTPAATESGAYVAVETPRHGSADVVPASWQQPPTPVVVAKSTAAKERHDQQTSGAKETKTKEKVPFKFRDLYRYASRMDMVALCVGLLMTVINGALFPCMALIFGEAISSFQPYDDVRVRNAALLYLGVAVLLFLTDYVSFVLFHFTAERQMKALREQGFRHMLFLDMTWYDSHDALQLSSRLNGDTVKIKDGMGQKLGDSLRFTAQFVAGYVIGFSKGWQISIVMACVMPCIAVSLGFLLQTMRARTEFAQKIYAEAGAVAEETLGQMRTVASNNGEQRAIRLYNAKAQKAEDENIKLARITAVVIGVFFGSMWLMYAAGLWYGGKRVADAKTDPGSVFSAFFGILIGTMSMAQISPNITAVAQAKGAAAGLYAILATKSAIDASAMNAGTAPNTCEGRIEAVGVEFFYPSRPDVTILKDYNVRIAPGETVAFVGASGGGKSTLIALLERFYDPIRGQILLDGRDITTLSVQWLRAQIGLVSQEPVLFATTIFENIAFGSSHGVTRDEVIAAAKLANAHDFIMRLPQQYDTTVGEKGISLSGGQKQRVAIARAIVRKPKILVLDEATSALDNESERVVQAALNELMAKTRMTTLVIAHRLSTIRNVDKIVVLAGGGVVEEGTHDELMSIPSGLYKNLYKIQAGADEDDAAAVRESFVMPLSEATLAPVVQATARGSDDASDAPAVGTARHNEAAAPVKASSFTLRKAIALGSAERSFILAGCIGAMVVGASMPGSAILISGLVGSMTEKYMLYQHFKQRVYLEQLYDQVQLYGACYVGGAGVLLVATAVQQYCFKYMSEKLTSRLRDMHFTALCRQNIAFFDEAAHATGALTADLATNATKVALLSGDALGRVVQAICTFVAAIVISFTLGSWLLTFVMLAVFPLLIAGQFIRIKQMKGDTGSDFLGDSGAHASQALSNIRTVVSLGLETQMVETYGALLLAPLTKGTKEAHVNGLALGFSSGIVFAVYSLVFWYGGTLVSKGDISFQQLMRSLMAIMMSAQGIGSAASWLADTGNATQAGSAIFDVVETTLTIDSFATDGRMLDKVEGKIEFQNITFRYPTRLEVPVLRHYDLTIEAGQTVAFCGPSGGGKSTCISLIERFYDPLRGQVLLDSHDIKSLNLQWLRRQIGLVGQEPTLFIGTIAENIAYALPEMPSQEEIEVAAKMANAHTFIANFPDGYKTQVGMRGEKLSGGQKQRIAIARAILKNPNILLLDEATSALDSESEKIVQEALDKVVALKRRTTIIIAHRLSTIRKADKICVVSGGKIAEQGTHAELLALGGIYKKLVTKE
jgi:ATP-binding cassette, subfamily B (MDR/TAP), member 1